MKSFGKYIVEFIAIFLGISLGFLVDEIRENNEHKENLEFVKATLLNDLEKDKEEIHRTLKWADGIIECLEIATKEKPDLQYYTDNKDCRFASLNFRNFQFNKVGYSLLSSGLRFVGTEDATLLGEIEEFYSYSSVNVDGSTSILREYVLETNRLLSDEYDWFLILGEDDNPGFVSYLAENQQYQRRAFFTLVLLRDNYKFDLEKALVKIDQLILKLKA